MPREVKVGLLVLTAVGIFVAGIFLIGDRQQLFARKSAYSVRFNQTAGGIRVRRHEVAPIRSKISAAAAAASRLGPSLRITRSGCSGGGKGIWMPTTSPVSPRRAAE